MNEFNLTHDEIRQSTTTKLRKILKEDIPVEVDDMINKELYIREFRSLQPLKCNPIEDTQSIMRKIEETMNQMIRNGVAWSSGNTCITYDPTNNMSAEVYLHGNHIATVANDGLTLYSGGGWFTNTTKARLNALINEFCNPRTTGVFQKNYNWFVRAFGNVTPFVDGISIPIV